MIVTAYQFGQYAMLFLAPTGLIMATLQMLDMKYSHWFKFMANCRFVFIFGGGLLVAQVLVYSYKAIEFQILKLNGFCYAFI